MLFQNDWDRDSAYPVTQKYIFSVASSNFDIEWFDHDIVRIFICCMICIKHWLHNDKFYSKLNISMINNNKMLCAEY